MRKGYITEGCSLAAQGRTLTKKPFTAASQQQIMCEEVFFSPPLLSHRGAKVVTAAATTQRAGFRNTGSTMLHGDLCQFIYWGGGLRGNQLNTNAPPCEIMRGYSGSKYSSVQHYELTAAECFLDVKRGGFEGCFFYFTLTMGRGLWEPYIRPLLFNTPWTLMNIANQMLATKEQINNVCRST